MSAKPLTLVERAAVAKLLAERTPGQWSSPGLGEPGGRYGAIVSDQAKLAHQMDEEGYGGAVVAESVCKHDRQLIAQAPDLLERYEATVRQLEQTLAEVTGVRR